MDILDNIIYATLNRSLTGPRPITSDYVANPPGLPLGQNPSLSTAGIVNIYNYTLPQKMNFCSAEDISFIEKGVMRHWYDVDAQDIYPNPVTPPANQFSNFVFSSTYHMIYAYLIENTRILQIFERVIERYLNDEEFGIANQAAVFNWIQNSEKLFFKSDTPKATNLRSLIRPSSDASRRNAYNRMFGMDLAFGNSELLPNSSPSYTKARANNSQFIVLFERYLTEIWQGYLNRRNTSGANSSDINILTELALQLQEMLAARRGRTTSSTYAHQNLSKEEFSSVLINSWFAFIISYDSPVVNFLSCQSSTIGERLLKIGNKVGIPAHGKAQSLFEMAASAGTVLLALEVGGLLDNPAWVQAMLSSLNPGSPASIQRNYMTEFLTVINNWEKATGHNIKNPEANISGTVSIRSNGVKTPAMN